MILKEKLLLEEDNFEDTLEDEVVDSDSVDEVDIGDTFEDEVDDTIPTEEPPVTDEISAPMTTYKVSFNLGSHNNWSRVDATSEEEAKQIVQDYVTQKWPNRKFEFVEVEEFDESEMEESLNESIADAQPFETESAIGMSMVISDLIKDEYEAIDGYNSAIATAEAEGWGGLVKILTDIQAEEHIHIGQLQELLKSTDPNADKIIDGHLEAIYQQADVEPELSV